MKVVLFCGGLGTRLREHSETIPKSLVNVGHRPILWNLMKYYAYYGHTDFVLCLGYRGDLIRKFFLEYDPRAAEDFVLEEGGSRLFKQTTDVLDWRITFVDTGLNSNVGERLFAVRSHVQDEEIFHVNYSDQLTDLPLDKHLKAFQESRSIVSFVAVTPSQSFHLVEFDEQHNVTALLPVSETRTRINGGFMLLRNSIFEYMREGEELVEEPFHRLLEEGKLTAYPYDGFWKAMDTLKEKLDYDRLDATGDRRWMVWS